MNLLIGSHQILHTLPSAPHLEINGKPVWQVFRTKAVGVHIDQNLSWNVHIDKLSKNIASGIEAIKGHSTVLQCAALLRMKVKI